MNNRGLSLIEGVIYLALVSILLVTIVDFSGRLSASRLNTQSQEQLTAAVQFFWQRLALDVRETDSINSDSDSDYLHLDMDADDPADDVYYYLTGSTIYRQVGSAASQAIISGQINVLVLTFTQMNNSSSFRNLKIDLTLEDARAAARPEYNHQLSITTALTLRQ